MFINQSSCWNIFSPCIGPCEFCPKNLQCSKRLLKKRLLIGLYGIKKQRRFFQTEKNAEDPFILSSNAVIIHLNQYTRKELTNTAEIEKYLKRFGVFLKNIWKSSKTVQNLPLKSQKTLIKKRNFYFFGFFCGDFEAFF